MSAELLRRLRDAKAFEQSPPMERMSEFHVPFDALVADADGSYEQRFRDAVIAHERVALIGVSGSGKTSITEHVVNHAGPGIAPLRIRMAMQASEMECDPAAFPHLVVTEVAKQLASTKRVRDLDRAVRGGATKRAKKVGLGAGIPWFKGDLAMELGSVIEEPDRGEDAVDRAIEILNLIAQDGFVPTLLLDDTDQWIRRPGLDDPEPRIAAFFGTTLRFITERLPAACVIAVHNDYLTNPHYQQAAEFMNTRITLPALTGPDNIAAIAQHRATVVLGEPVHAEQIIDSVALQRLFSFYTQSKSLRQLMSTLHDGLGRACDARVDTIGVEQVTAAIAT